MKRIHVIVMSAAMAILAVMATAWAPAAMADGMIVPVRPELRVTGSWAVKYHHVSITVRDQVASVTVDQEFVNTGRSNIEVEYMFPVPPDAAIDGMTLVVNGKEFSATLMKADEARKVYEDIVRSKKDPALLEYVGFGLVKTSAFPLEPDKPAHVIVNYKSVCKKDFSNTQVWYPLNTEKFSAKAIEEVTIKADIKADADITAVYSPTHDFKLTREDARHVIVKYEVKNATPTTDFQLFYKTGDEEVGATLLTRMTDPKKDGYFLMLVSPNLRTSAKQASAKDVVLVFDHSGSMAGEKIDQAKAALTYVLKNLNKSDRVGVVSFSDEAEQLTPALVDADKDGIEKLVNRVDRIEAGGGTNIYSALTCAMKMLGPPVDVDLDMTAERAALAARPKYIIFMTDGQATVGQTAESEILTGAKQANGGNVRVFAFGAGYDVNVKLLDKLVEQNNGKSDYVKPKEDIEGKISALYNKIKNPVMTGLKVSIKGVTMRNVYPQKLGDLFEGDQIVLAGRYEITEATSIRTGSLKTQLVVSGMIDGKERAFEYNVGVRVAGDEGYDFIEKIWAMRRVGFLMDEIQLNSASGKKELTDELISLSKQYGIMTPYTSFLADERTHLHDGKELFIKAEASNAAATFDGSGGQMNAVGRSALKDTLTAGPATSQPSGNAVMVGNSSQAAYEKGESESVGNVRQVGNQAVYQRGKVWIASNASGIDMDKDAAKIQDVTRYSDEYFKIVRANSKADNELLSQQRADEELVVQLRGQVYRFR